MNIKNLALSSTFVLSGALLACSGGAQGWDGAEESIEQETTGQEGNLAAADEAEQEGPESAIVFEHQYSDSGSLTVHESEAGELFYGIAWKSESDDQDLASAAMSAGGVVAAFEVLSPDLEVPEALRELDARITAQANALRAIAPSEPAPMEEAELPVLEKSYDSFLTNVCRTFYEGFWNWKPWGCWYSGPVNARYTSYGYNNHLWANEKLDRVYAQNDGPVNARVRVCSRSGSCSGYITLAPGYAGYMHWYTPIYTNDWRGRIKLLSGRTGALGATIHYANPVIK